MSKKTFGIEEKNKMLEALNILEDALDNHMQYGESWWTLPGMNGVSRCDPFDNLRCPPYFSDYD